MHIRFFALSIYNRDVKNLSRSSKHKILDQALESAGKMLPLSPDDVSFLLQDCSDKDLKYTRKMESLMSYSGLDAIAYLADFLIRLFTSCNNLSGANQTFNKVKTPSVYTWSAIIAANAKLGEGRTTLEIYSRMLISGNKSDKYVYLGALKACTLAKCLTLGRLIHDSILTSSVQFDVVVGSTLIDMYAKCGSFEVAHKVFYSLVDQNVVSWGAIIAGFVLHGEGLLALEYFDMMQMEGILPSKVTFLSILKACGSLGAIEKGRFIHQQIIESECTFDVILGNTLIDMYAKCGNLEEAFKVLDQLSSRNIVSWNAFITGCAQNGESTLALETLDRMQKENIEPNGITLSSSLKACSHLGGVEQGRLIHQNIISSGTELDVVMGTSLVDMYLKSGSLDEASKVFNNLKNQDAVSWCAMVTGYSQHGEDLDVLCIFEEMQEEGIRPSKGTFLCTLKACSNLQRIQMGRCIHDQLLQFGLPTNIFLGNGLTDMYVKCGSLVEAQAVFDKLLNKDAISWAVIIGGYAQYGEDVLAINLYNSMRKEDINPEKTTFVDIIKVCGSLKATVHGRFIHEQMMNIGNGIDLMIGNTIIDMYTKCGSLEEAFIAFSRLPNPDIVSWCTMMAGYVQNGKALDALRLLEHMQKGSLMLDKVAFLSALQACAISGSIEQGRRVHKLITESRLHTDVIVGTSLVDMYAKCGNMEVAQKVFDRLEDRDAVVWDVIIAGYANDGNAGMASQCLQVMQEDGIRPNGTTFASILIACSNAGLLDEGHQYFIAMRKDHGITSDVRHNNCMVDLLGRAGCWAEIQDLMYAAIQPNVIGWTSVISACRMHSNAELAKRCFDELVLLDPDCAVSYILMANICAFDI